MYSVYNLHKLYRVRYLIGYRFHVTVTHLLQEFDTRVYKLNCNLLKTVKVPEPVPEVEMTNEVPAGSAQIGDSKLSDQTGEVQNEKLAGV